MKIEVVQLVQTKEAVQYAEALKDQNNLGRVVVRRIVAVVLKMSQ